jgi:hypothetical protein
MTSIDIQAPVIRQKPANLSPHIPASFWAHLEAEDGQDIKIQCAIGRHGPLIYIINPVQQRRWQKEMKAAGE